MTAEDTQKLRSARDSWYRAKLWSAAASLGSVLAAIIASLATFLQKDWLPTALPALYVALAGALVASVTSITVGAALRRRRQPREVFVLYSRKDLPAAKEIAETLRGAGFLPWLDVEQLAPGQNWPEAVTAAMAQSGVAVVLMSENLNSSRSAQMELLIATKVLTAKDKRTFPLIPVRLDDSEPPKVLKHVLWVDWREPEAKGALLRGLAVATGFQK